MNINKASLKEVTTLQVTGTKYVHLLHERIKRDNSNRWFPWGQHRGHNLNCRTNVWICRQGYWTSLMFSWGSVVWSFNAHVFAGWNCSLQQWSWWVDNCVIDKRWIFSLNQVVVWICIVELILIILEPRSTLCDTWLEWSCIHCQICFCFLIVRVIPNFLDGCFLRGGSFLQCSWCSCISLFDLLDWSGRHEFSWDVL